jgi:prepilin-type N-terminal cleavage/methylation domain-containing protein/prepilin-type processing-associated H-X9-DG protein
MPSPRTDHRGFTLIELLVVISIIALLIAILLPALGSAKRSAGKAVCLSNTRTISLVMDMYAQDDPQNFYPTARMPGMGPNVAPYEMSWLALAAPYIGAEIPEPEGEEMTAAEFRDFRTQMGVYECPSDPSENWDHEMMPRMASYGINAYITPNHPPHWGIRPDQIAFPSTMVLAAELLEDAAMDHFMPMFWGDPPAVANPMMQGRQWDTETARPRTIQHTRHIGGSANYIFADGHAAAHPFDETWIQTPGDKPQRNWYDPRP